MTRSGRHTLAVLATVGLAVLIAYLTLSPPSSGPGLSIPDKLAHFLAFAGLIFPYALLYRRGLIWMIPIAVLFGGAIEIIQPNVGRSAELADFFADVAGVIAGTAAGYCVDMAVHIQRIRSQDKT